MTFSVIVGFFLVFSCVCFAASILSTEMELIMLFVFAGAGFLGGSLILATGNKKEKRNRNEKKPN